jgi:hypothetical protein
MATEVSRAFPGGLPTLIRTVVRRTVVYISHPRSDYRTERYVVRDGLEMFCGYADELPRPASWQEDRALYRHDREAHNALCERRTP